MKYGKAKRQLRKALNSQKTISTKKLAEILQSMNISLSKTPDDQEASYLKNEIKKLIDKA